MSKTAQKEKWIEIVLTTPHELSDALSNYVTELGAHGVSQEELAVNSFIDTPPSKQHAELKAYLPWGSEAKKQLAALKKYLRSLSAMFADLETPTMTTTTIVDPDWGEKWKKYFKPLRISRDIVIKPTWERYAALGRDIVVDIDPGMAFGTGQHPSTRMCIIALEELITNDRRAHQWSVLDIGTGTGILAICCAKFGVQKVTAVDLDAKAIEIAGKNIIINNVGNTIEIINRDVAMCKGSFDLIVANLSSSALIKLKPHITRMTKPNGYMVLSGIIDQDMTSIEQIFHTQDILIHKTLTEKEWVCYVLEKRSTNP